MPNKDKIPFTFVHKEIFDHKKLKKAVKKLREQDLDASQIVYELLDPLSLPRFIRSIIEELEKSKTRKRRKTKKGG